MQLQGGEQDTCKLVQQLPFRGPKAHRRVCRCSRKGDRGWPCTGFRMPGNACKRNTISLLLRQCCLPSVAHEPRSCVTMGTTAAFHYCNRNNVQESVLACYPRVVRSHSQRLRQAGRVPDLDDARYRPRQQARAVRRKLTAGQRALVTDFGRLVRQQARLRDSGRRF